MLFLSVNIVVFANNDITVKLDGETLPTTYNHGGWFAEGDHTLENGMTQTEASQVTNWHTIKVVKEGKELFYESFKNANNEYFNTYLDFQFFSRMKKGEKFALISLNSVAGMIVAFILMNFMLKADKIFRKIFKIYGFII